VAAGAGTDVGDAALLLFTQTATERAHSGAHKPVCLVRSFCDMWPCS